MLSYCISLKENEHQRQRLDKIYKKFHLNVQYEIVERSPKGGIYGCFESHVNVINKGLTQLKENNYKYLFIMEDDVYFDTDQQWVDDVITFLDTLDNKTCWAYNLGYFTGYPSWKMINQNVKIKNVKMSHCYCMHAYIIPIQTAEKLSKVKWDNQAIDWVWNDHVDVFYAPCPMIALQTDHISSIQSSFWHYCLYKIGFKNIAIASEKWSQNCYLCYSLIIFLIVILFILFMLYFYNDFTI